MPIASASTRGLPNYRHQPETAHARIPSPPESSPRAPSRRARRTRQLRRRLQAPGRAQANLEKTTPLNLAAARRTHRVANEELAYFEATGRAQREKSSRFNLKSAEQRLEGAKEELNQLEKMYKADDLTE